MTTETFEAITHGSGGEHLKKFTHQNSAAEGECKMYSGAHPLVAPKLWMDSYFLFWSFAHTRA